MRATVRVPATSANLGPGFDCFGLALELCNELTVDTDGEPGVIWEGEGATDLPANGSDLVTRTIRSIAAGLDQELPSFSLRGVNEVPIERGLGSSSAATVAGVIVAALLLELGWEHDRETVFAAAAEIEGHPDNAAAAVYGGFTLALDDRFVRRFDPHPDLDPVLLVPDVRLATGQARAVLPASVSRDDAVFNVGHAALMVEAITREPSLLAEALHDRLHEDARLALVPDVADAVAALRRARIPTCVSGAGPSILAFPIDRGDVIDEVGGEPGWRILRPGIRMAGFEMSAPP
jgi:homoserine kinase